MQSRYKRASRKVRSNKGSITFFFWIAALQVSFTVAALSVDIAHQVSVRSELNAATDAAAIAGEEVLLGSTPPNVVAAEQAAQNVINANYADGKLLGSNVTTKTSFNVGPVGDAAKPPTLTVQCSIQITNLFSSLFGHAHDTLSTTSEAAAGEVATSFNTFPLSVVNRNYVPGSTYTWYISDAPGLVPSLVNSLSAGLTGYSSGSSQPPYPNNQLGYNTAQFLTTFNGTSSSGGVLGAASGLANGVGGPLGLGSPGTVLGGVLEPTVGTTGSTLNSLLNGSTPVGPETSSLSMLDYWAQNISASPSNSGFELTTDTQPSANGGSFPTLPATPLAPPSLSVGQDVVLTSGADANTSTYLNTTAQFLQGPSGNQSSSSTYGASYLVAGANLPSATSQVNMGSVANWLAGQTVVVPVTNPIPSSASLTVPIVNIDLLQTNDSTASTFSSGSSGLLGPVVEPLTSISNPTTINAVVDRFIAIKITSVTVEYQGAKGVSLLGLSLLNNPWAQQVVKITGIMQANAGVAGYGSSNHVASNQPGAYAAMLIQ